MVCSEEALKMFSKGAQIKLSIKYKYVTNYIVTDIDCMNLKFYLESKDTSKSNDLSSTYLHVLRSIEKIDKSKRERFPQC